MSYFLRIKLESALNSSAGADWANQVDSDIAIDDLGLPRLPARRLKGLWRDGLRDLGDALQQCGIFAEADSVQKWSDNVFGPPGAGREGRSRVEIEDAYLEDFKPGGKARERLKMLLKEGVITSEELMDCFARTRGQTAQDACTGAPKKNTLRFVRALVPNSQIFIAPVVIRDLRVVSALALGAAAVQEMGLARTRGLGQVSFRLLDPTGKDLTEDALQGDGSMGSLTDVATQAAALSTAKVPVATEHVRPEEEVTKPAGKPADYVSAVIPPSHILRFRLILRADALFPNSDGDPNTVTSATYIPGANLLGCFAWAYLANNDCAVGSIPDEFERLFLRRRVFFLNGYPEATDQVGRRLVPAPHALRETKDSQRLVDLTDSDREEDRPPTRRIEGRYLDFRESDPQSPKYQETHIVLNYHHERAKDRRFGRALGSQVRNGGQLYSYEAIGAGQSFIGAILGTETDLKEIAKPLPNKASCKVGRSASAQYGGNAEIEWLDQNPLSLDQVGPEWNSWNKPQTTRAHPALGPGATITITCLSPLLNVNLHGHPVAEFPRSELAESLGLTEANLKPCGAWARTTVVGGFLSHLRLPTQQWPALAAGSVFQFRLGDGAKVTPERVAELECSGLGLKRQAGNGRVAVNLHGGQGHFAFGEYAKLERTRPPSSDPLRDIESPLIPILAQVLVRRTSQKMKKNAVNLAINVAKEKIPIPTSSTLSRVALLIRRKGCSGDAVADLNKFREKARKKLRECRVNLTGCMANTLWECLEDWLGTGSAKVLEQLKEEARQRNGFEDLLHDDIPSLNKVLAEASRHSGDLERDYLLAVLRELAYKKRSLAQKIQESNPQ
jgi:CRISPR-associated protein Csx10